MAQLESMPLPVAHHSHLYWSVRDGFILVGRSLKHIRRQPDQLLGAAFQPILLIVMFKYLFGGAINTGEHESYINFVIAGIFIENAALTAVTTSTSVANDMLNGVIDRFRTLPMHKPAMLTGHVFATLFSTMVGTAVMVVAGLAFGFRPHAGAAAWAAAVGLTILVTLALSWTAVLIGLLGKSVEVVQQSSMILILPIIASSAFVPTQTMPRWLQVFANNQPMTQAIDAVRALLLGQPVENHVKLTLVWFISIIVVVYLFASYMFKQRTSD
jgi:ABC-2 type transport system permease protein